MLSIFSPSATESVGFSFRGSGANGAPTDMLTNDITGFQPQAYWNNLSPGSGGPGSRTGGVSGGRTFSSTSTISGSNSVRRFP